MIISTGNIPWKQTRELWCLINTFEPGFSNAEGLMRRPSTWSPVSRALQNSFISLPQTLHRGMYCITFPAIRCFFWLIQWVSGHWKTALRLLRVRNKFLMYYIKQHFSTFPMRRHNKTQFSISKHTTDKTYGWGPAFIFAVCGIFPSCTYGKEVPTWTE